MSGFLSSLTGSSAPYVEITFSEAMLRRTVGGGDAGGGGGGAGGARAAGPPAGPVPLVASGDDLSGELKVHVPGGRRLEHIGVKVEVKCVVEVLGAGPPTAAEAVSLVRDVAPLGVLTGLTALKWAFPRAALPHDSYTGANARVRYVVRASVVRAGFGAAPLTREAEIAVASPSPPPPGGAPPGGAPARLEVGIEDCLHIEFQYDATRLALGGVVTGHVDFLLVRVRIKHAELCLLRRETAGPPGAAVTDSETLSRFEIMDGAPVKGERVPIRMHLGGLDAGPSVHAPVAGLLSVRHFLNLVLVDEEDRRYFKSHEVTLFREREATAA